MIEGSNAARGSLRELSLALQKPSYAGPISIKVDASKPADTGHPRGQLPAEWAQPRRSAPQFFSASFTTADEMASMSSSVNVAFCGVSVIVTAIDFLPSSMFLP